MQNPASFSLPSVENSSTTSLMDAVVPGGTNKSTAGGYFGGVTEEPPTSSFGSAALGDASASAPVNRPLPPPKLTNGSNNPGKVTELERNLQKRRSLIPHLESELAELEAKIKAAEERLSQANAK